MNVLEFIAAFVGAVAWPLTILIVAWYFKPQVRSLLDRIRKGKFGNAEFEFEQLAARDLLKAGEISQDDFSLFNDLRALRNDAVHNEEFSPSPDSAIQYAQLADALTQRIGFPDRNAVGGIRGHWRGFL